MLTFHETIPLCLYIHIPWCIKKCPYCDFNSHTLREELPEQNYISALIKELDARLPLIWGRRLTSIFIGGGTPSLFSADSIADLLQAIRSRIPFTNELEITLEANPGTVDQDNFSGFFEAGVNRLSIGIQSFSDKKLKKLGRIHDSQTAYKAVKAARTAGFNNFNVDIMFALPQQTLTQALTDLQTAIDLKPPHLSWYQLTLEPNTLFYHKPPKLPDDDLSWQIQTQGQQLLKQHGYSHYEISAYSQNKPCAHNLNYWQFGDYLGIGAGAHSKLTDVAAGQIIRTITSKHPKTYLSDPLQQIKKIIPEKELPLEFMLNSLRLTDGFATDLFRQRTGLDLNLIEKPLTQAFKKELLIHKQDKLMPTPLGQQFLNNLLELFMNN